MLGVRLFGWQGADLDSDRLGGKMGINESLYCPYLLDTTKSIDFPKALHCLSALCAVLGCLPLPGVVPLHEK